MPWKERSVVEERFAFVRRLEAGESMSELCREFSISRKTGYKIYRRFKEEGPEGLGDESRRPHISPHKTSPEVEALIVEAKRKRPSWGSKKLEKSLDRQHPGISFPSRCTIEEILRRNGLVFPRRRRKLIPQYPNHLAESRAPNDVWCADFKGQFRMGNAKYCYPLTVSDFHTRYLLGCEAMESTQSESAKEGFEWIFREYGLPTRLRTDNGVPFSSRSVQGLSSLSVWWMRLGIQVERIEPGKPQQNGRHERMHRTLKEDIRPRLSKNLLAQQEQLDRFREDFNERRPHEALKMKCPADIYKPSLKRYPDRLPEPSYPHHDLVRQVYATGSVSFRDGKSFFISAALADQTIAFEEEEDGLWRINFMDLDLGFLDDQTMKFTPISPEESHQRISPPSREK